MVMKLWLQFCSERNRERREAYDETIKQTALDLIETLEDTKYKTKYMKIWK